MVGSDLLRYNKNQEFLIFDFETFHLNLALENPPWQAAWLIANNKEILRQEDHYINWGDRFKISKDARRITGYNDDIIKRKGKSPKEAYEIFIKDFHDEKRIIVGHNIIGFDIFVEKQWCEYVGIKHNWSYLNRMIDSNVLEKAIQKEINPNKEDFLAWQFKLNSLVEKGLKTSITNCCKRYEIDYEPNKMHKAEYDIIKNYEIFKKQLWKIEI